MKLSTKLTSLLLVLTVIPLVVVGYLSYRQGREALVTVTFEHLEGTALLKADAFDRWLEDGSRSLRELARRPLIRQYAATMDRGAPDGFAYAAAQARVLADHFEPALAEEETFLALSIVDATSGEVLVTTDEALADANLGGTAVFVDGRVRTALETQGTVGGEATVTAYVATPITGAAGQTIAVLLGRLSLDRMTEIVRQAEDAPVTQESYLVNAAGHFMTRPPLAGGGVLEGTVTTAGVQACTQGYTGSSAYQDYRGVDVFGAYRWLPEPELCLLTEMDRAEAVAPILFLRNRIWGVASVLLLLVTVAGLLFSRSLTGPLRQLLQVTRRIGAGDLDQQIPVHSEDEIGRLAAAFNQMTASLQTSLGETAHGRRLLLAVSDVAQAVQRAQTPADVYEALGREVAQLGFTASVFLFVGAEEMRLAYLGFDARLVQAVAKLTGLSSTSYTYPVPTDGSFKRVCAGRETRYYDSLLPFVAELLPPGIERLAGQVTALLHVEQGIVAPLAVEGELLGLLAITGADLVDTDVAAIRALAGQTAIALKKAQLYQQLRQEEARYRTIFEGSASAIFVVDVSPEGEFRFKDLNPASERLTGLSAAALRGKTPAELVPLLSPETAAAIEARYVHCLEVGEAITHEEMIPLQGKETWWLTRLSPQRDAAGRITRLIGSSLPITERKEAEVELKRYQVGLEQLVAERTAALERSETRFRALVQHATDIITIVDAEGTITYESDPVETLLGYRPEERMGQNLLALAAPQDRERIAAAFTQLLADPADPVSLEVRVRHKSGGWRTLEVTATNLLDNPAVQGIVVNAHDVTARKAAETALLRERNRFNRLLETSPVGITFVDRQGQITFANPRAEEVLGLSREKVSGLAYNAPDWKITDYEGEPFPEEALPFARARATGRPVHDVQHAIEKPSGERTFLSVNATPVFDEQGAFDGMVATVQDISERKHAAQALRQHEALLRNVLAHLPVGVWVTDEQGTLVQANPAAQAIWGGARYVGPEAYGTYKGWWLDSGEPLAPEEWAATRAIQRGEVSLDEEIEIETFDGARKIILNSALPLRDQDKITGAIIVNQDVTRLKQAQAQAEAYAEELARSNEELQQFAYVASHDLQEPLRMVSSFLQLLQRRYGGQLDETADEYIEFAVDGAGRMKELINDLLRYSRVATRGRQPEPVDSDAILETVLRDLRLAIADSDAQIVHDPLPTVMADAVQLRQLLQNLLGNALKFHGDDPPRVTISAERRGEMWQFAVRDEGIGVNPEQAERIFVIFQRLHRSDEYEGTGIGLAICKKIVERHGGQIWVDSEVGDGTTFYFTLPAVTS